MVLLIIAGIALYALIGSVLYFCLIEIDPGDLWDDKKMAWGIIATAWPILLGLVLVLPIYIGYLIAKGILWAYAEITEPKSNVPKEKVETV